MKFSYLKYVAVSVVIGFVAMSCDVTDDPEPFNGTTSVLSAKAELGTSSHGGVRQITTRAVNEADPTLTPPSDRVSHKLTVDIGETSGIYTYASGSWVAGTSIGAKFTGNKAADVELSLAPEIDNPVGKQDGSIAKLVDADILLGKLIAQNPVSELPPVTMTHANALLDFEINGLTTADLDNETTVITVDKTITPCRIPLGGRKLQAIIESGKENVEILITIGSDRFSAFVAPGEGGFKPNTRYTFKVVIEARGIRIENVAVSQWADKEPGSGTVTEVG